MTIQISRRGMQYLETARTLLRTAATMTDDAVTLQLKIRADRYQVQAVTASQADLAKALARSTPGLEASDDFF